MVPAAPQSLSSSAIVPRGHVVQFYQYETYLVEIVSRYVGAALAAGDAAVVIATKPHRTAIDELLKARGLDVAKVVNQGRYFALDANETLSRFMRNGLPDAEHFKSTISQMQSALDKQALQIQQVSARLAADQPAEPLVADDRQAFRSNSAFPTTNQ